MFAIMKINFETDDTGNANGVHIVLTPSEVATAIDAYLVSHGVNVIGPRNIRDVWGRVGAWTLPRMKVKVGPSGCIIYNGQRWTGDGRIED